MGVFSDRAPAPVGAYCHAKRVGDLLFLSGLGPRKKGSATIPGVEQDAAGNVISHDITVQCHSVFENLKTVLEDAGSSLDKVVDVTVYLTDMKRDFKTFNAIWAEYFGQIQPCRTTVEIGSLPTPIAIEFKAIATV